MTFDEIATNWELRPNRNCPGRFVIRTKAPEISVEDLLGPEVEALSFQSAKAIDTVLVVRMDKGGLISYKREDGTYLHTLNTAEGFARKLLDLGIELAKE